MIDSSTAPDTPVRYLLDHRLLRLLCSAGQEEALERFRASLAQNGFGSELPPLQLTPLALLETLGIEPQQVPAFPLPAAVLKSGESLMATTLVVRLVVERYREDASEVHRDKLRQRVEEMRKATPDSAHDLFDLCLTQFVSREGFEEEIYGHLSFDYMYRFPFAEVIREEVFDFLTASLFAAGETVSGVSKARIIKEIWGRAYERLLRGNPTARAELQALDREIKPRSRQDYLEWELIHHAVLGYAGKEEQPQSITSFILDSAERSRARCIAYKSTVRAFLDQIERSDLSSIRSKLDDWRPGVLVPSREDGSLEAALPTADLPVFAFAKETRGKS
ncbi:MAG TPA: hypothetical protein VMW27_14155 [Thermoanaerobaculia bacterium]|nr:hypothetical protein [Thermoanaerobaculia bacterium]